MKGRVSEHHMGGVGGTGPLSHYGLPTPVAEPAPHPRVENETKATEWLA